MSGQVYRIHDFDLPENDENLGRLSLSEVEDALDTIIVGESEAWAATLNADDNVYLYVDGSVTYWGSSREQTRATYEDREEVDWDATFEFEDPEDYH